MIMTESTLAERLIPHINPMIHHIEHETIVSLSKLCEHDSSFSMVVRHALSPHSARVRVGHPYRLEIVMIIVGQWASTDSELPQPQQPTKGRALGVAWQRAGSQRSEHAYAVFTEPRVGVIAQKLVELRLGDEGTVIGG
jgi:hypothetical protein